MPAEMGLNVIQAASDHPSDLRYDPSPTSLGDSAVFYQRIREAIALHQQQTAAEPAPRDAARFAGSARRRRQ